MHNSSTFSGSNTHIPAFNMFIIIHGTIDIIAEMNNHECLSFNEELSRNQLRRCNVPPNHRPVCSSISQKHYHPWAGHDSSRNKGQCRLTHRQGLPISQTHTAGSYQVIKELGQDKCQAGGLNTNILMHTQPLIPLSTVRRPTTTYHSKTIPSQLCEEGKDNRVTIPTKRRNTALATRQLSVVLGPIMAKTT